MDRLTFPKDAFLMSFLLRSSFALHLQPSYRRGGSSSSSSTADAGEASEPEQSGSEAEATEQRYFRDACRTCESTLEAKIAVMPKIKITQEHVDKVELCSICMENFNMDEEAKSLPCSHLFHDDCITPWLKKRQTCPICRKVAVVGARKDRTRSRFYRFQPFRRTPGPGIRVLGHICRLGHNHATPE